MKQPKKVLFFTNILSPYMHQFFNHLTEYPDEIEFKVAACKETEPDRGWNMSYLKEAKYNYEVLWDAILLQLPFQNRFVYFGGLSLFKDILFGGYSTVIFKGGTRFIGPFFAIISRLLGKKTILWEEDNLAGTNLLKKIIKPLYINRFVFSEFIALGTRVVDFLKPMVKDPAKIYHTYYTIDNDMFRARYLRIKHKRSLARKALGISENRKVILCIARFINDKNLFTFMDALAELKKHDKNFTCYLLGNGLLEKQVRLYRMEKGLQDVLQFVSFKQFRKLTYYYLISDVFVLPSKIEPWGLVVNEAMIFDLPVIVSDKVGSGDDLVKQGVNGFVFPYQNHLRLVEALKKVLSDPQKYGRQAYDLVKDKNFEHVSRTIISASESLQTQSGAAYTSN